MLSHAIMLFYFHLDRLACVSAHNLAIQILCWQMWHVCGLSLEYIHMGGFKFKLSESMKVFWHTFFSSVHHKIHIIRTIICKGFRTGVTLKCISSVCITMCLWSELLLNLSVPHYCIALFSFFLIGFFTRSCLVWAVWLWANILYISRGKTYYMRNIWFYLHYNYVITVTKLQDGMRPEQ